MTEIIAKEFKTQETKAQTAQKEPQRTRSLLSVSDNYAVNIVTTTARRETSMPGTGVSSARTQNFHLQPDRGASKPADARHAATKTGTTRETGKPALTGRIAPATVSLSTSAEKLSEAVRPVAPPKRRTGLRALIALTAICLLGAGSAITLPRLTKIESVRISGLETLSENAIVSSLGGIGDQGLFSLKLSDIERSIAANPRVAHVKVYRILPSTLGIDVQERSAVASIAVTSEQGTKLVLVDGEGIAFAAIDAEDSRNPELPVISGIQFSQFTPGQHMPEALMPLFTSLDSIKREAPVLLKAFSEIRAVRISGDSIELLLYPVHMKTAVRMPLRLNAESLRSALVVLDILRSRGMGNQPSEIDFHSGTVVYQTKEAVSG